MEALTDLTTSDDQQLCELFTSATSFVRTVAGQLKSDELLYLYARFKQANEGACNEPRPGMFDFQGKSKWDAWKKLGDKSKKDSMLEYIDRLTLLDPEWEDKIESGKVKPKSGMGVAVSTLKGGGEDGEIERTDEEKTVFDWCQDGNTQRVVNILTTQQFDVNQRDESGMSLLHWACDRGYDEMVQVLLDHGADVNIRDVDGQTPLHYGVSCDHSSIIRLLISRGADASLTDESGVSPSQCTDNEDITALLTSLK